MDAQSQPTSRQLLILAMLANGKSREFVARYLTLAPRTIRNDLDELRECIGAVNVTHAVSLCLIRDELVISDCEVCVAVAIDDVQRELVAA